MKLIRGIEFPGACGGCGVRLEPGDSAWWAAGNALRCQECGPDFAGDDDSAAVTFWGKRDLREVLRKALTLLDAHYAKAPTTEIPRLMAQRKPPLCPGPRPINCNRHEAD